MNRRQEKFIHVGNLVARVEVDLIYTDDTWSPCLSLADAQRLDEIRTALQKGDIKTASRSIAEKCPAEADPEEGPDDIPPGQ